MMKLWLNTEFERLTSIKSGAHLYRIFFRLVQSFSVLGLVYLLFFTIPFLFWTMENAELAAAFNLNWIGLPFFFSTIKIIVAELALHAVDRKEFWGITVGLLLAAFCIPSLLCLVGVFGFYCFLNVTFQKEYLQNSPLAFRNFLQAINLNLIGGETKS